MRPVTHHSWQESEDSLIIRNYGNLTIRQLASKFNRTTSAVKNRLHTLGLTKGVAKFCQTKKQKNDLVKYFNNGGRYGKH